MSFVPTTGRRRVEGGIDNPPPFAQLGLELLRGRRFCSRIIVAA
jgi:hypothetical protein